MLEVSHVPRLPSRDRSGHKGTYGSVLIVAGDDGMLGAAILCARGALRGGAGLVQACLPRALMAPFTVAAPAALTRPREGAPDGWLSKASAVAIGPGLGTTDATKDLVRGLLDAATVPVVLDADALNVLAPLRRPLASRAACVLTPHPGEAARLLGTEPGAIQADREAAVEQLCQRSGQVVLLKGAGTLVCDGERLFRVTTGNPGMATGGSGDVLTGLLAALLAQGMTPFDAACLAGHVHGAAGDLVASRLSEAGLIAEDLPLAIAELLR